MDNIKVLLEYSHGKLEPWRIVLITEDNKSYISMIEKEVK